MRYHKELYPEVQKRVLVYNWPIVHQNFNVKLAFKFPINPMFSLFYFETLNSLPEEQYRCVSDQVQMICVSRNRGMGLLCNLNQKWCHLWWYHVRDMYNALITRENPFILPAARTPQSIITSWHMHCNKCIGLKIWHQPIKSSTSHHYFQVTQFLKKNLNNWYRLFHFGYKHCLK